jgi:allantoin racemase
MPRKPTVIAVLPPIPVTDYERKRRALQYQAHAAEGVTVDVRLLQGGPALTDREYELFWSTGFMILEAETAAREGAAAIVIDCTADPGIIPITEAVDLPVVGALRAAVHLALQLGSRFSVLALDDDWARMIGDQLQFYGLRDRAASIETVGTHVYNPRRGRVMNKAESRKFYLSLLKAGRQAAEAGADSVILGSTTIIEGVAELEKDLGIPVIPPGIAALKTAELMLAMGIRPSRHAYPSPVIPYGREMAKLLKRG